MKDTILYEAPKVEVIEVEVEKGYQGSINGWQEIPGGNVDAS